MVQNMLHAITSHQHVTSNFNKVLLPSKNFDQLISTLLILNSSNNPLRLGFVLVVFVLHIEHTTLQLDGRVNCLKECGGKCTYIGCYCKNWHSCPSNQISWCGQEELDFFITSYLFSFFLLLLHIGRSVCQFENTAWEVSSGALVFAASVDSVQARAILRDCDCVSFYLGLAAPLVARMQQVDQCLSFVDDAMF